VPLTDFATKGSRLDSVGPHAVPKEDRVNEVGAGRSSSAEGGVAPSILSPL
jgi:hypothetical protein